MNDYNGLTAIQARTVADHRAAFEAVRAVRAEMAHGYAGSMWWKTVGGAEYLYRKSGRSEKSLGRRAERTEAIHAQFTAGREALRVRLASLERALAEQIGLALALGLGRVPADAGRILRRLDEAGALGRIRIVGTNALYGYEAIGGVHFSGEAVSTADIDLLLDARHRLRLVADDADGRTLIGLLVRVDRSFRVDGRPGHSFRAVNGHGYMVELIRPQARTPWAPQPGDAPLSPDDLSAAAVEGLQWLVNVPAVDAVAIDALGYPAPMRIPDPRVWAAHKLWLAGRPGRDPVKRSRDVLQARCVKRLIDERLLQYETGPAFVETLPTPLRAAWRDAFADATPAPLPNW